jgi:hypothetical protein
MGKVKSQLRFGLWPKSKEREHHHVGLTVAARRLAESALEELGKFGVIVNLEGGKARFRSIRPLPPAAMRIVETHADLIEAYLREKESNQCEI